MNYDLLKATVISGLVLFTITYDSRYKKKNAFDLVSVSYISLIIFWDKLQ